jgi:hypothetical protein
VQSHASPPHPRLTPVPRARTWVWWDSNRLKSVGGRCVLHLPSHPSPVPGHPSSVSSLFTVSRPRTPFQTQGIAFDVLPNRKNSKTQNYTTDQNQSTNYGSNALPFPSAPLPPWLRGSNASKWVDVPHQPLSSAFDLQQRNFPLSTILSPKYYPAQSPTSPFEPRLANCMKKCLPTCLHRIHLPGTKQDSIDRRGDCCAMWDFRA